MSHADALLLVEVLKQLIFSNLILTCAILAYLITDSLLSFRQFRKLFNRFLKLFPWY
jgi:hypothetical protein